MIHKDMLLFIYMNILKTGKEKWKNKETDRKGD